MYGDSPPGGFQRPAAPGRDRAASANPSARSLPLGVSANRDCAASDPAGQPVGHPIGGQLLPHRARGKALRQPDAEQHRFVAALAGIEDLARLGRAAAVRQARRPGPGVPQVPPAHPADMGVGARADAPPGIAAPVAQVVPALGAGSGPVRDLVPLVAVRGEDRPRPPGSDPPPRPDRPAPSAPRGPAPRAWCPPRCPGSRPRCGPAAARWRPPGIRATARRSRPGVP